MALQHEFRRHICEDVRQVLLKKETPLDFYQRPGEPWLLFDGASEHVIKFCPYCGQDLYAEDEQEQDPQALLDLARVGQVPGRERRKA